MYDRYDRAVNAWALEAKSPALRQAHLLTSSITLGKVLNFSVPQFPNLSSGGKQQHPPMGFL